jgi:hypothetical protein
MNSIVSPIRNSIPSPMRKGLQPHDMNRPQKSLPAQLLSPSPFSVSKPPKVSINITQLDSENVPPLMPKRQIAAVRFKDFDPITSNDTLSDNNIETVQSPSDDGERVMFSPQTPGIVSRKVRAGHTPFKGDTSMAGSVKQDSFMQNKFGHNYGIDKDYDHDYSLLNKTNSSDTTNSFNVESPLNEPKNIVADNQTSPEVLDVSETLMDLLQYPANTPQADRQYLKDSSILDDSGMYYQNFNRVQTPLSSISATQSPAGMRDLTMSNGLSTSFLLKGEIQSNFITKNSQLWSFEC